MFRGRYSHKRADISIRRLLVTVLIGILLPPVSGLIVPTVLETASALTAPTTGGAYFNKTKMSYLTVSASSNFQFSTSDDFTIAWWQYSNDNSNWPRTWSIGNGSNSLAVSQEGGTFYLWRNGGWSPTSFVQTTTLNTWVHYAVVRSAGTLKVYENGKQKLSVSNAQAFGDSTNPIYIGTNLSYSADQTRVNYGGYLTGFEIIKGNAKYSGSSTTTENFTIPNTYADYTTSITSGTKFLLFPTSSSNLTSELSGNAGSYTITNNSGLSYNDVTYGNPDVVSRTVTFDSNSGSGSPSAASLTGNPITLATSNTLSRTGYTFAGWNTAADGSGANYAAGSSYSPAANVTLYAQWNSTITYDANAATSGTAPTATTAKSSAAVTTLATNSGTLAKSGFTFGGWNTAANGTGTTYTAGLATYSSAGNVTLYAQWNSVITYSGNSSTTGSVPAASTFYGTSGTLATNSGSLTRTLNGLTFSFGGWNTNETGTGTNYAAGASYVPAGNKTLYAQWNSAITYNGNSNTGGSIPSSTTISGTSGVLATNSGNLVNGVKVFAGWNTNSSGTGTRYAAGGTYPNSGSTTLYAQWVTALTFTGTTSITASQGGAYRSDTYTALNGLDTKTVSYSISTLNSGITLETTTSGSTTYAYIRIASTVTAGTYIDTLTATDSLGSSVSVVVTIAVVDPIQWGIFTPTSVSATLGTAKSVQITTTGGSSGKAFTLTQGALTSKGITLDTSTASSGYVTLNVNNRVPLGTYSETITVTDSTGRRISTFLTLAVVAPVSLSYAASKLTDGYSSIQLNGSSQYLSLPASAKYQLGSSWTVEWWQYETDTSTNPTIFSLGNYLGFYFDSSGTTLRMKTGPASSTILTSGLTPANYKNKWTHFAVVSNGNAGYIYVDGVALNSSPLALVNVTSSIAPSSLAACLGTLCGGTSGTVGYYFGGYLANFSMSKRVDYTGTSTSSANFTPSTTLTVDSATVLALIGLNGSSNLYDFSPQMDSATTYGSPVGSFRYPNVAGSVPPIIETTEGRARQSGSIASSGGTGTLAFTSTMSTPGVTFGNYYTSAGYTFADTATAVDSVTARITTEYFTSTDQNGSQTTIPVTLKINPPFTFTATSFNPVVPALVNYFDTVTATFGSTVRAVSRSTPTTSSVQINILSDTQTVINVRPDTPQGTYYETITVYGSYGESATTVITITVTPGLSLSATDSATTLSATSGTLNTLRINALNGSGSKTFTLAHMGSSTSSYITLDTSTASSNYVTLRVGSGGTVPAGSYSERITVVDGVGSTTSLTISVTVNAAPTISYKSATSGAITLTTTAGKALTSAAFTAALGTGTKTMSLSGLNSGITLDTSTANTAYITAGSSLTSNSTTAKSYYDTLTVTDSLGATTLRAFTVVVNPAISGTVTASTLTITSGVTITDTVTALYGTGVKTFAITSSPSISGITNTTNIETQTVFTVPNNVGPGTYTITVTATDSVGATNSVNVTLVVNSSLNITGSESISMTTGYAYNTGTYYVSGGTGSFSYALTGTLNASYISLESLSSTTFRLKMTSSAPSGSGVAATYNESVTVTDSTGAKASFTITLTVNPVVSLTGNQTINTTFGVASTNVYQTSGGTAPFNIFGANQCVPVVTTDGSYTVLKFIGIGSCTWTVPEGVTSADALVVGGGGAGGTRAGGGGGGGGVQSNTAIAINAGSNIALTVGAGGTGVLTSRGGNGGNSIFGSITSIGGGSGGGAIGSNDVYRRGADGGSGGGAAGYNVSTSAAAGSGTAGQGFGGGLAKPDRFWPGGGGGGASSAGETPTSNISTAGKGGSGYLSSITGSAVCYATGGGGGTKNDGTPEIGVAGGGGDCGGTPSPNGGNGTSGSSTPSAPSPNTGAGGGGSGWSSNGDQVGGNGASGVVIVRYLTPATTSRSLISYVVDTYTVTGKIVVSVPDSITVGSYVETFTVRDSANASSTYVVTVVVAKATPTVLFSIPGGGSSATYGTPVALTATSSTSGKFTFKKGGTNITGCVDQQTSGGTATCNWTPTDTSTVTMSASFTPNDLTNYNTVTTSNFTLSVLQADTLTVSFTDQNLTYSESGTAVSRAFTITGLASIDTVTAVATAITGTANDSSAVNVTGTANSGAAGTSTLTKAGVFSLSGTGVTFTGSTKASYYKAIAYTPGVITVNKAGNAMTLLYGSANTITYKPAGTETATATYKGTGTKSFSTTSSTYCSVDPTTGALTTVQAGSCDVQFAVADGPNYLGDTITATVRINKAARTITANSAASSLKYGETTTVTYLISAETATATVSISTGSTSGCSVDIASGILTATSGTTTCSFTAIVGEGTNYLGATSNAVSVTLSKANAPVLTLTPPASVDYSTTATSASMPLPTFAISGLKLSDTLTAISGITLNYVATGTYAYNSTTVPVNANTYTITPSAITLSSGDISNYNTPTYTGVSWIINQINQDSLTVKSLFQEGITVPFDIQYTGGTTGGTVSGTIVAGGTASNCYFVGRNLRANSTGTCLIRLTMLGNQNYRDVTTDVSTVLIANFVQNTFNFDAPPAGTVIAINSQVPIVLGPEACTENCQPTITAISPTTIILGTTIVITGTNFTGADAVIFNRSTTVNTFQVDNGGTTITINVPTTLATGDGTGTVSVRNAGKTSFRFSGLTFLPPPALG